MNIKIVVFAVVFCVVVLPAYADNLNILYKEMHTLVCKEKLSKIPMSQADFIRAAQISSLLVDKMREDPSKANEISLKIEKYSDTNSCK